MLDNQGSRDLIGELVFVTEGNDIEVIGDIAGLTPAIYRQIFAIDVWLGDLRTKLDIIALFEQDPDGLGGAFDTAREDRGGSQKQRCSAY